MLKLGFILKVGYHFIGRTFVLKYRWWQVNSIYILLISLGFVYPLVCLLILILFVCALLIKSFSSAFYEFPRKDEVLLNLMSNYGTCYWVVFEKQWNCRLKEYGNFLISVIHSFNNVIRKFSWHHIVGPIIIYFCLFGCSVCYIKPEYYQSPCHLWTWYHVA